MQTFSENLEKLRTEGSFQKKGWSRFEEVGLPTKEMEAFRYVPLRRLYEMTPVQSVASGFEVISEVADKVIVLPLEKALKTYAAFLNGRYARAENDPFALLNSALADQGLFIYVPPKVKATLVLKHQGLDGWQQPRLHVFVGKESELKLKLDHVDETQVNGVIDCALEEGAHLHFRETISQKEAGWSQWNLRATLKRDANLDALVWTDAMRYTYALTLLGENASATLKGAWDLDGKRQTHIHGLVEHVAPHCTSLQNFRGVLRGTCRSSFEGKIYVHPEAQKTEAFQNNHNLVLSDTASAYAKPNLEIFADDVKASHGATVGQLDQEHLFYLKSRGLPEEAARALLVEGFLAEMRDAT